MGAAHLTYMTVAYPGVLGYAVTNEPTDETYDTLATVTGASQTLTGAHACPFKVGGVARLCSPDDNTVWNFGVASSPPDAADTGRQLIVVPAGAVEFVHVPYGAYPAVKTA